MKKLFLVLLSICLTSCAHGPKCGNPDSAKVVLEGVNTCKARIRQVTLGTEMKIPESLKDSGFANFNVEWVDSQLTDGRVEMGHFVLVQNGKSL